MSNLITGYSVAGVIEADPNNEFVWVKFVACSAAVAAARTEVGGLRLDNLRDGYEQGVRAAREAVAAENEHPIVSVTTEYDEGYRDGTNDTVRLHLRAIDALEKP